MDYPEPLVIHPRALPHKQTFVLLHGLGSSADKFGPALLDAPISPPLPQPAGSLPSSPSSDGAAAAVAAAAASVRTLARAFPHARFVFPTAPRRRATLYRRALTRQWFDCWDLDPPATAREELQAPGLRETTAYLHGLWHREIAATPGGSAANVVVGGLSQGSAATLVALLLWEGEPLGVVLGLCGWLPYAARLQEQLTPAPPQGAPSHRDDNDSFDPFEREEDEEDDAAEADPPTRAIAWLREELASDLEAKETSTAGRRLAFKRTPIFFGHGAEDDKVSIVLGREAGSCLRGLGAEVCWNEYESLGHWYSGDLLRDMVQFIQNKTEWED